MEPELKANLGRKETWKRGLFMVLFTIIYSIAEVVVGFVILLQFLFVLVGGTVNTRLKTFGCEMAGYVYAILAFLTFNTEEKPYPFAPWATCEEAEEEDRPA